MLRNKANSKLWSFWLFPIVILSLSFIIELGGDELRETLRYQADSFTNKEVWRLLTGHLSHLGWSHFCLNGLGFLLVWSLFGESFKIARWSYIFIACCLGISAGFYFLDKGLQWYVGLSGVLHGLIMAGLVASLYLQWLDHKKLNKADLLLLLGVIIKLAYEQAAGAVPFTESSSGGPVVVNAHFYGAIIGTMCALLFCLKDHLLSKSEMSASKQSKKEY